MKVLETERKLAEKAKAALVRRNESLVQALGEVVYEHVISTDEIIWGGDYTKIFGYSEEEMGKDGESWTSRVHPDDLDSVWEEFDNAVKERRLFDLEYRFRCRDGSYRWMHDRGVMHINDDGKLERAIGIFSDITERRHSEEDLRVAHKEVEKTGKYLETLIEDSLDAIISTDKEGMVVLFNKGAEVLLGYRREEVFGQRVTVLYESEERAKEVMRQMRKEDGAVSAFETILRAKDGSQIPVLISASILYDEEGEEAGTVGFNKDLRERKRSEEELRERHEELKQSYDALERAQTLAISAEKLAALGRLTAGVSHEMLNPLNIITMSLQLMTSDPETPPEIARQLRILDEQADRIVKIAQNLLYFARQRKPERLLLDFNDTLQRTLGLLARDLHLQNIAVELTLAEGLPPLLADQGQLQQVVLNLLTNARDAMPKGGRLSLSTKSVQTNGQKFVELRVEDTGEGIAPEHLENLFDPFFTTKPVGEGTGLGLSICQGIVEAHGGSIRAENLPEGGAAFVVRLGMEEG